MPEKETLERAREDTRKKAERDYERGKSKSRRKPSATRSRAVRGALKREGHGAATLSARAGGA